MQGSLTVHIVKNGEDTRKCFLKTLPEEIIEGLIYGTYYALRNDADRDSYIIKVLVGSYRYEVDFKTLATKMYQAPLNDYDLERVNNLLALRSVVDSTKKTYVTTNNSNRFIQGLMTALNFYNVNVAEVLLAKPYSHGVHSEVEGLDLPRMLL